MVHIIYKDGKAIGWEMKPTTQQEQEMAARVRDLQFFGFDETAIGYNGLTLIDDVKGKTLGNIKSLSWVQKKHQ